MQASFITEVLNAVPNMMMVLNEQRQIVAINEHVATTFGITHNGDLLGARYGEAMGCIHSAVGPDGCGTSLGCSVCGAVQSILESQRTDIKSSGECRITTCANGGTSHEFNVQATPIQVGENLLTIFALRDVGSEKRRQMLEHTFFHDILNTVGGLRGIADNIVDSIVDSEELPSDTAENAQLMVDLSDNLVEEIAQQRRLLEAERGEYVLDLRDTELKKMLEDVCKLYGSHVRTPNRTVVLKHADECRMATDSTILRRVVGNMVLNALEATPAGGAVTVALVNYENEVAISVRNAGEIPRDVQLNIFQRSFSTKGSVGRGIGTYSMKLFGERYLGGVVGFTCQQGATTFFIKLPLK